MRRAYDTRPRWVDTFAKGWRGCMSRCMRRHELTLGAQSERLPAPQEAVATHRPDLGRSNLCNTLQEERSQQPHSQSTTFWPWRMVSFSLLTTGGVSCLFSNQVRIIALGIFTLGLISTMMLLLPAVWSRKPARRQAVRLLIRELRGGEPGPANPFVSKGLHTPAVRATGPALGVPEARP